MCSRSSGNRIRTSCREDRISNQDENEEGYPWLTLRTLLAIVVIGLYMVAIRGWTSWDYVEVVVWYTGS